MTDQSKSVLQGVSVLQGILLLRQLGGGMNAMSNGLLQEFGNGLEALRATRENEARARAESSSPLQGGPQVM